MPTKNKPLRLWTNLEIGKPSPNLFFFFSSKTDVRPWRAPLSLTLQRKIVYDIARKKWCEDVERPMPGYTEMNNAVKHLVTISAQSRASKTHGEERSNRKVMQSSEAMEKHQGWITTQSNKGCRDGWRVTPAECTNKRRSTTRNLCLPSIRNVQKIGNKTRRAKNRNKEKTYKK